MQAPPARPAPPGAATSPGLLGQARGVESSPSQIYEGFRNQRRELSDQLDRLNEQRESIAQQLRQPDLNSIDQKNLEQRLVTYDQRINATEKLLAEADASVARSAATPGAVMPTPPPPERQGPPDEFYVLIGIFFIVVLMPLSIALARRIWKRSAAAVTKLPQEIYDRFARVDSNLEAIAIEVERIGEGQRFLTRLQTEQQRALSAGAAERIEVPEREREKQGRTR